MLGAFESLSKCLTPKVKGSRVKRFEPITMGTFILGTAAPAECRYLSPTSDYNRINNLEARNEGREQWTAGQMAKYIPAFVSGTAQDWYMTRCLKKDGLMWREELKRRRNSRDNG